MGVFCDTSVFTAFSLQRSPSFCADVSGGGSPVAGPSRQGPSAPPMFAPRPPVFSRPSPPPIDTSCAQSQPLERVPTEPVDTPVPEKPQQPTPEELLRDHGIKVRDFAFEASALPPVPVVRRPPVRELKRVREESDEEREWRLRNEARRFELSNARVRQLPNVSGSVNVNNNASASASASTSAVSRQDLQRKRTELVIPPSVHTRWYGENRSGASLSRVLAPPRPLRQLSPKRHHVQPQSSQHFPSYSQSQSQSQSQSELAGSSQPPLLSASQADSEMDDEEYVKTPLVTPNGSLVYSDPVVDASTLPESQVAPLLAASQQPADEDVSVSQMGLGLSEEQAESQPAWQLQSQSQSQCPGGGDGDGDVPMRESQMASSYIDQERTTPTRLPAFNSNARSSPKPFPRSRSAQPSPSPSSSSTGKRASLSSLSPARRASFTSLPSLLSPGTAHKRRSRSRSRSCSRSGHGPSFENEPVRHDLRNADLKAPAADAARSVPPPPPAPHTSPAAAAAYKLRARSPRKAAVSAGPGMAVTSRTAAHAKSRGKGRARAGVEEEEEEGLVRGSPAARPLRRSTREKRDR